MVNWLGYGRTGAGHWLPVRVGTDGELSSSENAPVTTSEVHPGRALCGRTAAGALVSVRVNLQGKIEFTE